MEALNELPTCDVIEEDTSLKDYLQEIDESVATLITLNHADAWDYGWSFFKTTLVAIKKLTKNLVVLQASAIGLAFSKEQEWQKFLAED